MSTTEQRVAGEVPRWELGPWRNQYGLVAGITGRGGDPAHPFDLGLWTNQPVGEVMTRWRQFRASFAGFPSMVLAHQVHGTNVLWHDAQGPGWTIVDGADGHATSGAGTLLLITVADCIPVYLAAPRHHGVALLHAGWRGTAGAILERGVELLCQKTGASPADLVCHHGVGISGPEYEVGAEVMTGTRQPASGPGPWHLDLRAVLGDQARALGIGEVTVSDHCSARERDAFFSHRRSGGRDGRMVAYLGMPDNG